MDVTAKGTYEGTRVTVDLGLTGGGGISLTGGGAVSLEGDKALNLKFDGRFPFSILAGQLAAQGFVLTGPAMSISAFAERPRHRFSQAASPPQGRSSSMPGAISPSTISLSTFGSTAPAPRSSGWAERLQAAAPSP